MTNVPDFVRDNVIALKARIAELEAALSFSEMQTRETLESLKLSAGRIAKLELQVRADVDTLRSHVARIAELEASLAASEGLRASQCRTIELYQARLAAVIALCDADEGGLFHHVQFVREVRAAAEGDTT